MIVQYFLLKIKHFNTCREIIDQSWIKLISKEDNFVFPSVSNICPIVLLSVSTFRGDAIQGHFFGSKVE